jgi:hypothetical protein
MNHITKSKFIFLMPENKSITSSTSTLDHKQWIESSHITPIE